MAAEHFEHAMSDSDALMWHIERDPHLRSTIVTVLVLDHTPDWERVRERLERGTRLIPRMRQRVVEPAIRIGPPAWSSDPDFDLSYHARRVRVPAPGSFDEVLDIAATAAMSGFDRARPLWEYTLVEGLADGRAAFVLKVHHSMTDGVGGMRLLLMLFDLERDPAVGSPDPDAELLPEFSPMGMIGTSLEWQARRASDAAQRAAGVVRSLWKRVRDDAGLAFNEATQAVGSVARFLAPASEPLSPVMAERSLDRRLTTFSVPLDDLRRAADAVGGTLNDAFVAGVIGGMRRYHDRHDVELDDLRMVMPINLRGAGMGIGGNHFTLARLLVPLGIDDVAERVRVIGDLARRMRAEPAVALSASVAGLLNRLPRRLATSLFGGMLKGTDFVTSNVPGSPFPLYLCGARVQELYAFGPLSGGAANITLVSHCGVCCIGINSDTKAIPDTRKFTKALRKGLKEVIALGG